MISPSKELSKEIHISNPEITIGTGVMREDRAVHFWRTCRFFQQFKASTTLPKVGGGRIVVPMPSILVDWRLITFTVENNKSIHHSYLDRVVHWEGSKLWNIVYFLKLRALRYIGILLIQDWIWRRVPNLALNCWLGSIMIVYRNLYCFYSFLWSFYLWHFSFTLRSQIT